MAIQRKVAEIDLVPVPYEERGTGEPVLMIHLPTSPHHCFGRNIEGLSKHFRVFVLDLRPAVVLKTWMMRKMRLLDYLEEVVLKFIDHMGFERVHLVGGHKAGPIAMYLTVRHPEKIHKLVLYSTLGLTRLPSYAPAFRMIFFFMRLPGVRLMGRTRWIRQFVKWGDLRGVGQWRVGQFFGLDEPHDNYTLTRHLVEIYTALLWPPDVFAYEVMVWTINYLKYDPVIPLIPKISVPTFLVFGDDPYAVPKDKIEEYRRLIKNAEIMVVERTRLYPHYEQAESVNKRTAEFLANG